MKLTDKKIEDFLKDFLEHLDYDLYKEMFIYKEIDQEFIDELKDVVKKHFSKT
jgi:hypothetical protein